VTAARTISTTARIEWWMKGLSYTHLDVVVPLGEVEERGCLFAQMRTWSSKPEALSASLIECDRIC
jgi:hypothetical protein